MNAFLRCNARAKCGTIKGIIWKKRNGKGTRVMRRIALIALLAALLACTASAEEKYDKIPQALQVSQTTQEEKISKNAVIRRMVPTTSNAQVDEEMRQLVDELTEKNRESLPPKPSSSAYLEVGPVITRTGTSWMSFLTLAETAYAHELLNVDFEARVYDMATGERISLTDVFAPESEAWDLLAREVRAQLSAAFPGEEPDARALDALCERENLENAAFTMSVARLSLTYRADAVYPGRNTLLHVTLYYPDIRPLMTPRAQAQTDNSRFKLVALTFDDGNVVGRSRRLLETLRRYGAQATYFIVGRTIRNNHDILSRLQNGGYSVQSHSYTHPYAKDLTPEKALKEKEDFAAELSAVTGIPPALMRSPGGKDEFYVHNEIGYPLIHWSVAGGDSGGTRASSVEDNVLSFVRDGDVVLLHETNENVPDYTKTILRELAGRGYLCVTVQELFAARGVALEPNRVYFKPTDVRDP